jgi:hypothetical protein
MPTTVEWLDDHILSVTWEAPLMASELKICFNEITEHLEQKSQTIHILFDIQKSGSVPAQAPVYAIRSRFMIHENTGKIVVVGTDIIAQIFAQTASAVTSHDITFFPLMTAALDYIRNDN